MSDEAHRSQYGIFADNMMNLLPTAARIGFTGTPLLSMIILQREHLVVIFPSMILREQLRIKQQSRYIMRIVERRFWI